MKEAIDYILKKNKKPIDFDLLCEKVEQLKKIDDENYSLSREDREEIQRILDAEVENYEYFVNEEGKYSLLEKTPYRKGRLQINKLGDGVVTSTYSYIDKEGKQVVCEEKFSILKENCGNAIDGDLVLVEIGGRGKKARIERIISRTVGAVFGEITRLGDSYFVKPIDKKQDNLTIALEGDYIEGTIVLVSLEEVNFNFYKGKVLQEFRHKDDPHADSLYEAFRSGMPCGFSEESYQQLETIPTVVEAKDKVGREDYTSWEIISIDGIETKDKDDCISYFVKSNGNLLLGAHISDVPYYVPYNTPLYKDAFRKGTSYYFGGAVEPQFPRKISNKICSLNDKEDRLTKSTLMEYTPEGHLVHRSLKKSVIHSRLGMNYDAVNQILNGGPVPEEYKPYEKTLLEMMKIALVLRKERFKNGATIFSRSEPKFIHDANGEVIKVVSRKQNMGEMLIEEFMLAGNHNFVKILADAGLPVIYRVHGGPNRDKLKEYLHFLEVIGIPFEYDANAICQNRKLMQALSKHVQEKGGDLTPVLTTNLIRCMSHASYSTENIGHYGTGYDDYTHSTSPIRRLADYINSMMADECLFEKDPEKRKTALRKWNVLAKECALQASKMERVAEEVEKNVQLMDTAKYFMNHIGEEYEGVITSISNHGFVVQLDNLLEGRVRTNSLPGDYIYNPNTFTLLSLDDQVSYFVGDRLKVKVIDANKENKTVEFTVVEKIRENPILDITHSNDRAIKHVKEKKRG